MVYKILLTYFTVNYSCKTSKYLPKYFIIRAMFSVLYQKNYSTKGSNRLNSDIWEVNVALV